ncbi:MAG: aerial mycelium formation protein [Actinomycetota bacterium]
MTDAPTAGGKRRIDEVLGSGFVDDLGSLETPEVRRRRDLAKAELEYVSFLRRLLQGRRDILRDELDRRRTDGAAPDVVERVVSALSEGIRGPSQGRAPTVPLPEDEIAMARRRVEKLVGDTALSDLETLTDDRLEEAIGRIEEEERGVSERRAQIITVADTLHEEMKRRLRSELSNLSQ